MTTGRQSVIVSMSCLLALLAYGCGPADRPSDPVTPADLVGIYHINWQTDPAHSYGREKLTLRANGTFTQAFSGSNGRVFRNTGRWRLEQDPRGPVLHLIGMKQYVSRSYDGLAIAPQTEDGFHSINKHGRTIWLTVDEDNDLYYRK